MFAAYQDGSVKWNQSCVSIVKRTDDFLDVMVLADGALFRVESSDVERHFKPPLCQPHYSFVYGNDPERIPFSLDYPASFKSTEMVLMWTDPSNLSGVGVWKEVGRIEMA